MAETMAPEMGGLGFLAPSTQDSRWPDLIAMRKNKHDSPVEAPVSKAAVAGSGLPKSASRSDSDTKPAGNKVVPAICIKPAAKVEGKAKQPAAKVEGKVKQSAAKVEGKVKQSPAKVEGKAQLAAAKMKDRVKQVEAKLDAAKQSLVNVKAEQGAAKVEGKDKQAAANGIELAAQPNRSRKWKPAFKVEDKPEPKVIDVKTERLDEDYIEYLRTRPLKMPSPLTKEEIKRFPWLEESIRVAREHVKRNLDLHDDILRQHDEKGYAIVGIELLDNGMKRPFRLPVEETAA